MQERRPSTTLEVDDRSEVVVSIVRNEECRVRGCLWWLKVDKISAERPTSDAAGLRDALVGRYALPLKWQAGSFLLYLLQWFYSEGKHAIRMWEMGKIKTRTKRVSQGGTWFS